MKITKIVKRSIRLLVLNLCFMFNTFAQVPLVYDVENTGAACTAPPLPSVAQLTSYAMLPDPFAWSNGSGRIASLADWTCRRNEIKQEIERYEIGVKPPKPANITATYTGGVLTVRVTENGKTLTLTSNVTMPTGTGPFPVVIGMNAPTGQLPANLFNGVIQIPFNHDQVAKYTQGTRDASYPFFQLYPNLTSNGYYSAWAWGISRLIDGIELVQTQMKADTKRIAVTGCSYAGKMALFAGAFDERIALTIAQESGGGGVNSWRVSETIGNVEKIGNTNYSWFMQSMQTNFQNGNAVKLPHDHHELMAMIAPRALLVLGNPPFEWLGDESGYVSSRAAQEVWKTLGVPERFGFSFRGGHDHCSLPTASNPEVTAFVDKFLRNSSTANTNIAVHSFPNTDYNKWIAAWKGYVISPPNTNAPVVTITAPLNNASYAEGDDVVINATATITSGSITKVDFYNGALLLGTDATAPYAFTWDDVAGGKYAITAQATSSANDVGTSSVTNVLVAKAVFQTGAAPIIDGMVDAVWANYTDVPVTNVLSGTVASAADLSGNWKAMWDATNLYVLVQVTDDVKRNDSGTDVYNDDGVEIYVDFGNNKPADYGTNDHQFTFRWNDATAVYEINGHPVTGITKGIVNTTTGYIVEVRIPWITIGGVPAVNSLQGFDVMLNDDDNGTARDKKLAWTATTDDTWDNPSLMGTIVLKALNCTPPAATITASGAVTVCNGSTVVLNANTGAGFTYVWKKDNADITGATSASYTASASGSYTVSVISGGCSATSAATIVTVSAVPTPTITAGAATEFCSGGSVTLTSSAGVSYVWKNGTVQVGTGAMYSAASSGSYTVEVTNADNCKATSPATVVTVTAAPAAPAVTETAYCQGTAATQLTAAGTGLKWYADNITTTALSAAPTPLTTVAGTTSYFVSQTTNGCESPRAQIAVTIHSVPAAAITPAGPITIPSGGSVTLHANAGSVLEYKWFNGSLQVGAASSYVAHAAGSYVVEVTNAFGCKTISLAVDVNAAANQSSIITITSPVPNSTVTSPVTIEVDVTDTDGTIELIEYLDGNAVIGTGTSSPYRFEWANPGNGTHVITVRVTDSNGGITASSPVTITILTATVLQSATNIYSKVYPIPAKDEITVETDIDLIGAAFSIVNVMGHEMPLSVHVHGNDARLDVSGLAAGTYVLFINKNSNTVSKKITIIK